jgi:3D (Asp-Asp-Asp) domain-containing protein
MKTQHIINLLSFSALLMAFLALAALGRNVETLKNVAEGHQEVIEGLVEEQNREHICSLETVVCPEEEEEELEWVVRSVSAYTSHVEQTDDTPCLSADGSNICARHADGERLCAANFVPFGTVLVIDTSPEPDGEDAIVCVVADRMASGYGVDLYFGYDLERAINFGRQNLYVRTLDL